jgi:hypothetical protein
LHSKAWRCRVRVTLVRSFCQSQVGSSYRRYLILTPIVSLQLSSCDPSVREKAWRATSQALERMHNTLSHMVKT